MSLFEKAWKKMMEAEHIALITHIDPDADTIGSALGLYHALKKAGKRCSVIYAGEIPYNLDFLPGITKLKKELPANYDLAVALDASTPDRLAAKPAAPLVVIDHHRTNEGYGEIDLIDPGAAATAVLVYELLRKSDAAIPPESAMCLYTAIVDDSGFFRYESVNERLFLIAADLARLGARPHYVARMLTMREPLAKLCLTQKLLATLELFLQGRVGLLVLGSEMLEECGASREMADEALDRVRSLATVELAVMVRPQDGGYKFSLRSKDRIDAGAIARRFGGGGHRNAAGFSVKGDWKTFFDKLLQTVQKELDALSS